MAGYVLHLKEEESITLSAAALRRLIGGGNGDAALLRYTERFDGVSLTALEVTAAEMDAAWAAIPEDRAKAAVPPSRRARASCRTSRVGLAVRV